jgi:transcriptional regulator with XRE-family HTH domain
MYNEVKEVGKVRYTLRELRARKNKTQEEVAKSLGIATQTYNAWEKDISNVGISKVYALANYFGVKIDEIQIEKVT